MYGDFQQPTFGISILTLSPLQQLQCEEWDTAFFWQSPRDHPKGRFTTVQGIADSLVLFTKSRSNIGV